MTRRSVIVIQFPEAASLKRHGKDREMKKEMPEDVRKRIQQEFEELVSQVEQRVADWREMLKDPAVMPQTGELELLVSELDDVRYRLLRLKAE